MKFLLLVALVAFASAQNAACTKCYTDYAATEFDPLTINTLPTLKAQVCTAGEALDLCLTTNNCDKYYLNAWGVTCNLLQCTGLSRPCPTFNYCQNVCQLALDASVSAAAALANLPVFDNNQFSNLVCTAIDSLGQCATAAENLDKAPCNIESRNCPVLKNVCPTASCTPSGSLADLYIMAEKFRDLFEAQVKAKIAQIANAAQKARQTINGKLKVVWEITLAAAADRNAAIAAFRQQMADNLGVALARVTVDTGATPRKRQTAETWTVTVDDNSSSAATLAVSAAVLLFAVIMM